MSDLESWLQYKEAHGDCNVSQRWKENKQLANWVSNQRAKKSILSSDRRNRLTALGFDWNPIATAWEKMFSELVRYKERHRDCCVPRHWPENKQLGPWVHSQRIKQNALSANQRERLTALGFDWDPNSTTWELRFSELAQYKKKYGNCNVPTGWPENKQLATWVRSHRDVNKAISTDRRDRLTAIGFDWSLISAAWEARFSELVRYKDEHGDCNVPGKWPENNQLAAWVSRQRRNWGELSASQRDRLTALGFDWDPYSTTWELRFSELAQYKKKYGNCNVPTGWPENKQLKTWVNVQRRKKDKLSDDRRSRLEALGFDWDPITTAWEARFSELVRYKDNMATVVTSQESGPRTSNSRHG